MSHNETFSCEYVNVTILQLLTTGMTDKASGTEVSPPCLQSSRALLLARPLERPANSSIIRLEPAALPCLRVSIGPERTRQGHWYPTLSRRAKLLFGGPKKLVEIHLAVHSFFSPRRAPSIAVLSQVGVYFDSSIIALLNHVLKLHQGAQL